MQGLKGVTGSGKTFTMANVIAHFNRPTLVMSHNKTLAAQLYSEFRTFFPDNAVAYFVSYYDYYQPGASKFCGSLLECGGQIFYTDVPYATRIPLPDSP